MTGPVQPCILAAVWSMTERQKICMELSPVCELLANQVIFKMENLDLVASKFSLDSPV